MHDMLSLPNGSEKALFILLNYPKVFAKERYSIEYLLTENYKKIKDTQIFIYFGESDWMDQKGANNL
jgi:cardiolipin-specific phospholipase